MRQDTRLCCRVRNHAQVGQLVRTVVRRAMAMRRLLSCDLKHFLGCFRLYFVYSFKELFLGDF